MPQQQLTQLRRHPLTRSLYPIATGYYPAAQHHRMQRREHDNYLLIYCSAGEGQLHAGQQRVGVGRGDLVLLPKTMPHEYSADARRPWSIYWLHFDGELAQQFGAQLQMQGPCRSIGLQPRVIAGFDELTQLRSSRYQLPNLIHACHQLQSLLSYLAVLLRQQVLTTHKQIDWPRIQAVMQAHIHGQLNLDTLAAEVRLSKYHFSKKFKQFTGQSPIQYFINMKMQQACDLLDASRQTVKQIALSLGYEDVYYFSRLFKQVIGLSPAQYRQSKYR